jgi:integrase
MVFDIKAELLRRNKKYRVQGLGLYLEERNERLILRGLLPPKPNSAMQQPYRQRLDLGLPCTKVGVMEAEKKLRAIAAAIQSNCFDWSSYGSAPVSLIRSSKRIGVTVQEAIARAEKDYFKTRDKKDRKKLHSWNSNYMILYKQLPEHELLTAEMLRTLIMSKTPGTLHRNKTLYVCRYLAKVNGVALDTTDIETKTVRTSGQLRKPPSDDVIVKTWSRIKAMVDVKNRDQKYWRTVLWTYGMMAAYGLRPHEVLWFEWNGDSTINVLKHKTDALYGARENVYAFHRDWVDLFALRNGSIEIPVNELGVRPGGKFVQQIAHGFRRLEIGFRPYDLRHAYALRLMRFHVDFSISAVMMGHTVDVHMNTYRKWIGEDVKQEQLMKAYQEAEAVHKTKPPA